MQLINALALLASATFVTAAPVPDDEGTNNKPTSQCASKGGSVSNFWGVYQVNTMMPSAQGTGDWAGGFLDNLRGRCGAITNWQAIPDGKGGIACEFNASKFCQGSDVAAALDAASGEWVMCEGDTMNGLFDSAGNIIKAYTDYVSEVAGIVGNFAK